MIIFRANTQYVRIKKKDKGTDYVSSLKSSDLIDLIDIALQ